MTVLLTVSTQSLHLEDRHRVDGDTHRFAQDRQLADAIRRLGYAKRQPGIQPNGDIDGLSCALQWTYAPASLRAH